MASKPSRDEIVGAVEKVFDEAVAMLSELVAIDSTLNHETAAVQFMEAHFKKAGLTTDRFPVVLDDLRSLPGFSPVDWSYEGKECVVGVHRPRLPPQGKSLILNGHLDVVPTGPADMWTGGPFKVRVEDGRLYGRGSGDMKAGIVAYYMAFLALRRLGFVPAAEVIMQAVVEEEITGNGALACCARGYKADACIIPEPFAGTILTAQLGVMWLQISVRGRPAHVLNTSAGINGIEAAYYLYDALRKVEEKWNTEEERKAHPQSKPYDSNKHPINFNLGVIHGGEWASSVPTECKFEARVGLFPGKKLDAARKEIEEAVAAAAHAKDINYNLSWTGFQAEGCLMDPSREMMQKLGQAHKAVSGKEPVYSPVTCTTDVRFYELYYGIPATCYGPEATNIHGIDESVSLESVKEVMKTLAVFMADWCGLEPVADN
jgi:acetylornithine deacetylase